MISEELRKFIESHPPGKSRFRAELMTEFSPPHQDRPSHLIMRYEQKAPNGVLYANALSIPLEVLLPDNTRSFLASRIRDMRRRTRHQMASDLTQVVNVNKTNDYDVYIGRGSKWGNPFRVGPDGSRDTVILKYEYHLRSRPELMASLHELKFKTLGCHCKPESCHGDVLRRLAIESHKPPSLDVP